jgi:hypothetical protein
MESRFEEEDRKVRYVRLLVDLSLLLIRQGSVSRQEAEGMIGNMRSQVVHLFPDKGPAFDMIYEPRFRRAIAETFGPDGE